MADYRRTSLLKKELEKEEALLKNIKDKLVDQLQRLKVEELAIIGMGNSANLFQTANSTGSYFNANIQVDTDTSEMSEEVNSVPLVDLTQGLTNNSLILSNHPAMDQEEEEEEDED